MPRDRVRRPVVLGAALVVLTAGLVAALGASEWSGTGAVNVGDAGESAVPTPSAAPERAPTAQPTPRRDCAATQGNPGGTNNYIPDAPYLDSLGRGFVITGLVRPPAVAAARGCAHPGVARDRDRLEQDNRASVRTGPDGRYRIETAPTIAQFGEPNIHVGYDDGRYREVFIRRVVDLDDKRAVVDLTLERGR